MEERQIPWVWQIPRRRKWLPTPVFLPGKSHGQRSLAGHSPWRCRVSHDWGTNAFTFSLLERESFCPGPQGNHLVIFKYCASFSNYAFANVLLFIYLFILQQRTKSAYALGEGREELICMSPSGPGWDRSVSLWAMEIRGHCLWNAGRVLPCLRQTASMCVLAW